ncbi:MAG: glycosyltransferase, partial [Erysipelotrichaceae bacterium]|nr:glycosyltransferase [Erysipelotrichaceae bacterium]
QKGKMECKLAVQRELGLRESRETFLIAVVSRLAIQKGINLVIDKMQEIMNRDVQLIILGSGDKGMENYLAQIEHRFPHRAVCYRGYNEELAHRIYAGADAFLMPSLFEPCGISQLIAMRYGTLPIVRETGGLKDTVQPYNEYEKTGTGFTFRHFSSDDMMYVITMAIETYYMRKDDWKIMVKNAMSQKFDWKLSSEKYVELYNSI